MIKRDGNALAIKGMWQSKSEYYQTSSTTSSHKGLSKVSIYRSSLNIQSKTYSCIQNGSHLVTSI